jgi:hypothetical protein
LRTKITKDIAGSYEEGEGHEDERNCSQQLETWRADSEASGTLGYARTGNLYTSPRTTLSASVCCLLLAQGYEVA